MPIEASIQELIQVLKDEKHPAIKPESHFAELPEDGIFEMPRNFGRFFKVSDGNIPAIAIGVVASSTIGNWLSSVFPAVGRWATIVAGGLLLLLFKSGVLKSLAAGVFIGGIANLLSGFVGGGLGGMLSEDQKVTYGGGEGVYPMQPDRRTFA